MKLPTIQLKPHPLNNDIYGDGADRHLIQSIKDNGIIEPLIIDHQDRIVSGHRRWFAAREIMLQEVPVEMFPSHDELDIQTALVEANRQRVKTNEQLHALQHEIGFAEQEVSRIEDRELESMEATDRLEADRTRAEQQLQEQTVVVESEKSAALRISARDQEELKKLRAERATLRASSDTDLLANYDRVAKARKTGLAEVREQECQGCHVRMRPAQWQHLREGAMMNCESCGRMLYYDEGSDQKLAAKSAGQWDMP